MGENFNSQRRDSREHHARKLRTVCGACRPTTSIFIRCMDGIATRRLRRRCERSTILCVRGKSATSACPTSCHAGGNRSYAARAPGLEKYVTAQMYYSLVGRGGSNTSFSPLPSTTRSVSCLEPACRGFLSGKYSRTNPALPARASRRPFLLPF